MIQKFFSYRHSEARLIHLFEQKNDPLLKIEKPEALQQDEHLEGTKTMEDVLKRAETLVQKATKDREKFEKRLGDTEKMKERLAHNKAADEVAGDFRKLVTLDMTPDADKTEVVDKSAPAAQKTEETVEKSSAQIERKEKIVDPENPETAPGKNER